MRQMILEALRKSYHGEIAKLSANVEIFLEAHAGVGDHPDVIETIDKIIGEIAELEDKLMVLDTHFNTAAPRI
jgi:hypothetical protein|tara:strand:+ start:823 stop:1041 length:219 start_codon:yes stop_codon:yes gene_type:complete